MVVFNGSKNATSSRVVYTSGWTDGQWSAQEQKTSFMRIIFQIFKLFLAYSIEITYQMEDACAYNMHSYMTGTSIN
jgi:hypothetical protein